MMIEFQIIGSISAVVHGPCPSLRLNLSQFDCVIVFPHHDIFNAFRNYGGNTGTAPQEPNAPKRRVLNLGKISVKCFCTLIAEFAKYRVL